MTTGPWIEGFALTRLAPAKINLALHVVGQRTDGYHLLESLVTFTDAGDSIGFSLSPDDRFTLSGPFCADLPLNGAETDFNLVLKARDLLRAHLMERGIATPPVHLHLEKNLPVASGIGGGSADAAAALQGLLALWEASLDRETLCGIGLKLGADVPMCLEGRPLVAKGIGDEIVALAHFPSFPMLIVNPLKAVSTPVIFRMLAQKTNSPLLMEGVVLFPDHAFRNHNRGGFPPSVGDADISPSKGEIAISCETRNGKEQSPPRRGRCPEGTEGGNPPRSPSRSSVNSIDGQLRSDWIDYLKGTRNDLEPPARSIEPAIEAVSDALKKEDALFVRMSGSGATCFGLFATDGERDRAATRLSTRNPNWYILACNSVNGEEGDDDRD